jgi:hypothetical protein
MRCCRRMKKISWTDRVRNEVLHRVKEERNILHTLKTRKANWIGFNLRGNSSETHYWRKNSRRDTSDGKKRKKT